ncbi:MAG: hypothetical protein GKR97_17940 [Rhizobiaceae bacterium]|nr:hypothetical protein [Rhizobiaceae bacterium]
MTSALHISANQWRTSVLKACVGTLVARGIAEDIADACLALLALQQNPLQPLLGCLNTFHPSSSDVDGVPDWPDVGATAHLGSLQVLKFGPSIIDMAQAGIVCNCDIDSMILLLGLAQARLHSHDMQLECSRDGTNWQTIDGAISSGNVHSGPETCWLRAQKAQSRTPLNMTNLPQPRREDWVSLQQFADQIMVPADDSNRADAGAGLTDND